MNCYEWNECKLGSLPKDSRDYLVFYPDAAGNKFRIQKYNNGNNSWVVNDLDYLGGPTHWCELPQLPGLESCKNINFFQKIINKIYYHNK